MWGALSRLKRPHLLTFSSGTCQERRRLSDRAKRTQYRAQGRDSKAVVPEERLGEGDGA